MRSGLRFRELEGLRGYLALWVVLGHAIEFTTLDEKLGSLRIIADPGYAVQSFMILSGFVITHLLIEKDEPYSIYILRRFMRLFPIFVVCLGAGWLTQEILYQGVSHLPWASDPNFLPSVEKWRLRYEAVSTNPLPHLLAHLTMLHGAIPAEILYDASKMFIAPAWSISLEWQFYILAPAILFFMGKRFGVPFVVIVMVAGILLQKGRFLGTFDEAFLGTSSKLLVLGMVARLALPLCVKMTFAPLPVAAFGAFLVIIFTKNPLDLLPWAVVYPYLVDTARGNRQVWFERLLANRFALWTGRMSYSVYLVHFVVLSVAVYLSVTFMPTLSQTTLLLILFAVTVPILLLGTLLYAFVEKPGIAVGHLWAQRLLRSRPVGFASVEAAKAKPSVSTTPP